MSKLGNFIVFLMVIIFFQKVVVYGACIGAGCGKEDRDCGVDIPLGDLNAYVNGFSGNLYHAQTDFTLTDGLQELSFVRVYNSQDEIDGPFGTGWTHNYNIQYNTTAER